MRATRIVLFAASLVVSAWLATPASAGTIVGCGPTGADCSWSIQVDGEDVMSGTYDVDLATGAITLASPVGGTTANGSTFSIESLNGNADPILGFAVAAGTGAAASTFAFNLNLPIAISGLINADSSVSYSLTSLSAAGAQIAGLLGPNVVIGTEVDTSIGGLAALNKGVDTGSTFFFVGGPQTQASPIYTATNSFTGDLAYDLMSVTVAFSLSANSTVGVSGFVQQIEAPEPGTLALLAIGVIFVTARRRNA